MSLSCACISLRLLKSINIKQLEAWNKYLLEYISSKKLNTFMLREILLILNFEIKFHIVYTMNILRIAK